MKNFTIKLHWYACANDDSPRWDYTRALYAYAAPRRAAIYYLGKCHGTTVRERWRYDSKSDVWDCIEKNTKNHCPLVAEFELPEGMKLTKKLVAAVECLLIFRLQPPCNVQCKSSRGRSRRPGMKVVCSGTAWPLSQKTFNDKD
jgi:hypothetical protein